MALTLGKLFLVAVLVGIGQAWFFGLESWRIFPQDDVPGMISIFKGANSNDRKLVKDNFKDEIDNYDKKQTTDGARDVEMVNQYYNMATDFYEYGWGQSFHFAHQKEGETLADAISRHERRLADELGLAKGKAVIDAGCGVGGPAREVGRYSGATVRGVTINDYQVARAQYLTKKAGLEETVTFRQGDFTKMDEKDEQYDAAYAIEATCHAPTLESVFGEIHRVLKKGGKFATYEWIATPFYDAKNATHQEIMTEIEYGNGLPPVRTRDQVLAAAKAVGFKLVMDDDLAQDFTKVVPWYAKLDMSWWQHQLTHFTCFVMETLGFSDSGTLSIHGMLLRAADGLVRGGKANVFTPMHLFVFEKI
eukprot:Rhum_TRINITY_DN14588_c21_g1::Rhum_TRINITY_DN14588_c21_g1_i1::g.96097::m.96097/K00559/E2.1.1.41, SMT1, ERG6; sterol 24-C-methyltransferase